ncbi:MAG: hypothetical protein EHM20_14065 [Alphaproteobacteria bacterium]|nr:MAG: hypothetical protein EHM20_14065 [Alphaproteobacteria bacterium]
MKRNQLVLLACFLFTFSACKTQEDIRREKSVESLNEQVAQTQKNTANSNSRFMAIEEQVAKLTGQVEKVAHNKQQDIKDAALLKERLAGLEETNKKQNEYIKALDEKIQDQSAYIDQVIKSLSNLTDQQKERPASKKKNDRNDDEEVSKVATVKSAIAQYKEKDYDSAKSAFQEILDTKKVKKKDKEAAFHYLGQIEFKNKNYEEAQVYFSKLFSENPNSSYAALSLLGLAKSFIQLKSKEEASQTIDELVTRFPKSKEALEGSKLKTKL